MHGFDQKLHVSGWKQKKIMFRYASVTKLKSLLFWCRHNTFKVFGKPSENIVEKIIKTLIKHCSEGLDFYNPSETFKTKVAKLANIRKFFASKVGISKILRRLWPSPRSRILWCTNIPPVPQIEQKWREYIITRLLCLYRGSAKGNTTW